MVVWYTVTGLYITLHSSPARLGGIHPVQIHLIGIRDSRDHRSVRNLGGGGDSAYKMAGNDALEKFWIKPLKETDLGVAQAFLTPKRELKIYVSNIYFYILSRATLNEAFTAKYEGILPRTP